MARKKTKTAGKSATKSAKKSSTKSAGNPKAKASAKSAQGAKKTTTKAKAASSSSAKKAKPARDARLSNSRVRENSASDLGSKTKFTLTKLMESVANVFSTRPSTITAAIKKDHESLRNFISILKDTDRDMTERRNAYKQFSALLKSHSKSEEVAVYETAKKMTGHELHIKTAEGYVEHQVADDLMARIENATDALAWSAHANVLAESIEHHLDEEERDLLPMIHRETTKNLDGEMLELYLKLRASSQSVKTEKNAGALESLDSEANETN